MNDRTQSLINTANDEERLDKLLTQACALAMTTHGICGDTFRQLPASTQDAVLWALADTVQEVNEITRRLVWNDGEDE